LFGGAALQEGLEKNSIRYGPVLAVLSSVPWICADDGNAVTAVNTG